MNCRDIESLILAERDGALTKDQLAALSGHVAGCPACRELRTRLVSAAEAYRRGLNAVEVPDADEAWRELRDRLHAPARRGKRGPLAPVIFRSEERPRNLFWFGAPLAAAAAIAFAFFVTKPVAPTAEPSAPPALAATTLSPGPFDDSVIAGADFVEAGDPNASTLVFVDKESGWLVVWATDAGDAKTSG